MAPPSADFGLSNCTSKAGKEEETEFSEETTELSEETTGRNLVEFLNICLRKNLRDLSRRLAFSFDFLFALASLSTTEGEKLTHLFSFEPALKNLGEGGKTSWFPEGPGTKTAALAGTTPPYSLSSCTTTASL